MDTCDKDVQLPPAHALDYEALLSAARAESIVNVSAFLRKHLPSHWRDLYVSTVARPTNFARFDRGNFEYFCDLYSELEVTGEVAYDQTIQNRVIAVLGTSTNVSKPRGARMRFWFWSAEEFVAANRDRGHFIAHSIGGGLDVNVFWQDRDLNRGWSSQRKVFRQMETYCYDHPGIFCFSRPIYADGSSVPRWLEFGILRDDGSLWVEAFDNLPQVG
jgi:hypothetical protein